MNICIIMLLVFYSFVLGCQKSIDGSSQSDGVIEIDIGSKNRITINYSDQKNYAKALYATHAADGENVILLSEGTPADLVITIDDAGDLVGVCLGGNYFSIFSVEGNPCLVRHNGNVVGMVQLWKARGGVNESFRTQLRARQGQSEKIETNRSPGADAIDQSR